MVIPGGRAALYLIVSVGCDVAWREAKEETHSNLHDHDVVVAAPARVIVGGEGDLSVRDGCGPADNDECHADTLTITNVSVSGALVYAMTSPLRFTAGPDGGAGTVTVSVTNQDGVASTGSASVAVVLPDAAEVSAYCQNRLVVPAAPYLVPVGGEVLVNWTFLLDGNHVVGDTGEVPVDAPDLTFVEKRGTMGVYLAPATPDTIALVRSTMGSSNFEFRTYDPAVAAPTTAPADDLLPFDDAIEVDVYAEVSGRPTCEDPDPKVVRTETPSICLLGIERAESVVVNDSHLRVHPLAAGTCNLTASLGDTLTAVVSLEVAPIRPEDKPWHYTCDAGGGASCGVACLPSFGDEAGCYWYRSAASCSSDPLSASCVYELSTASDPATCPATTEAEPYHSACWGP